MLLVQHVVCFICSFVTNSEPLLTKTPSFILSSNRRLLPRQTAMTEDSASSLDAVVGQMRGGLTFLKTGNRQEIVQFYTTKIGMKVWHEQPNITILAFGNLLIGFNQLP